MVHILLTIFYGSISVCMYLNIFRLFYLLPNIWDRDFHTYIIAAMIMWDGTAFGNFVQIFRLQLVFFFPGCWCAICVEVLRAESSCVFVAGIMSPLYISTNIIFFSLFSLILCCLQRMALLLRLLSRFFAHSGFLASWLCRIYIIFLTVGPSFVLITVLKSMHLLLRSKLQLIHHYSNI